MYNGYRIETYNIHRNGAYWCFKVFNGDTLIGGSVMGTIESKDQAVAYAIKFCDWYIA